MCQMLRRKDEGTYTLKNEKDVVPALKAFLVRRRDKNINYIRQKQNSHKNLYEYWGKE